MFDQPLLKVRGVNAFYGTSQVLFNLNLEVRRGQVMALLGRNGAGKSTTFKALMGLLPPSAGDIQLEGGTLHGMAPHQIARRGLGYVPEDRQVFPEHTVQDNLEIALKAGLKGSREWTLARIYGAFPILAERRDRLAGRMSGGEQQMLSMARTLAGNPTVLLLDEPSEGLAPIVVGQIAQLVLRLREAGCTVLLAEQNMQFCLKVATHVSVIDKGTVVYVAPMDEFQANEAVKSRYLTA